MLPVYQNFQDMYSFFESRGMVYPMHLHAHLELYYAIRGGAEMTVGTQSRRMSDGDLGVAFPHRLHGYQRVESSPGSEGILAICPADVHPDYAALLLTQHPETPFLPAPLLHPETHRAFLALLSAAKAGESNDVCRAYVHLILARTLPLLSCRANRAGSAIDETQRVIEYVGEHFAEPLSLGSIGEALALSPFRVSRIFSEKLNISFPAYVNALRVHHAQMMLQSTDQDILSIAFACGYETPRTFNRAFKTHCGCTPREYRRNTTQDWPAQIKP